MSHDLSGRTAIVTGAPRGIGLATAEALVAAGANVVLTSRHQEAADEPAVAMDDLDLCVRFSNEAVRRVNRHVEYVHMPVVADPDAAFFAPLENLDVSDTKVFLGLVHHTDSVEEFRRRRDLARESLSDFGIASVCGFGRLDPDELRDILDLHAREAAEL